MGFLPLTNKSAEDYAQAFRALLPDGLIIDWFWDRGLEDLALGIGATLVRWHDRWVAASLEAFPGTASQTLSAWERNSGLPDPLAPVPTTEEERRRALIGRLGAFGGQSRPYFEGFADNMLGILTSLALNSPSGGVFRVGRSHVGDLLNGLWAAYHWTVVVPDTVSAEDQARLLTYLQQMKPSHTSVSVTETSEEWLLTEAGLAFITEDWTAAIRLEADDWLVTEAGDWLVTEPGEFNLAL